jgi:ribosome maturation factor RimP
LLPRSLMTPFEERLTNMIEPSLTSMGYDLVRVQLRGDQRRTLQIMAERQDQRGMTLNDCTVISETVSAILDVHDPIKERYGLEISSPGIDRPLTKPRDYDRYKGFEAKIDLKEIYEGRRNLKGYLQGIDGENFVISNEVGDTFSAPLALVNRAKLILTDELIDAHLKAQQEFETIDQTPQTIETDNPQED